MIRARSMVAVATAAIALLAVAGCSPASDEVVGESSQPSAEPTPSASDEAIGTSDWLAYSTHDGDMTYRYPADWTLEQTSTFFSPDAGRDDVADPYERWMDESSLTAPNGQTLLRSEDFVDIGGYCEEPTPGVVLHSEATELLGPEGEPAVIAVIAAEGAQTVFAMGITSEAWIEGGQLGCPFSFVFATSDGGVSMGTHFQVSADDPLWNVASVDAAETYMETDEYATMLEILRSVRTS